MTEKMPVLFVGHGSPMNAIEDNEFSHAWSEAGRLLPKPKAILAISAHWETRGMFVTAMEQPRTIYDFYGFPRALYEVVYPAPGSPDMASSVRKVVTQAQVQPDFQWGLDHGTWSVLHRMFPQADIPVVQLSLDRARSPQQHYELARQLKELREEGVLILSSGNIVHNLHTAVFDETVYDWAVAFDRQIEQWILNEDHKPIVAYEQQGQEAQLSVNSAEHYLPLLYTLGLKDKDEPVSFFADKVVFGSISMRSIRIG